MAKHRSIRSSSSGRSSRSSWAERPHALARRHGISRNLIKIWVAKYEAGGLDSERGRRGFWPTTRRA